MDLWFFLSICALLRSSEFSAFFATPSKTQSPCIIYRIVIACAYFSRFQWVVVVVVASVVFIAVVVVAAMPFFVIGIELHYTLLFRSSFLYSFIYFSFLHVHIAEFVCAYVYVCVSVCVGKHITTIMFSNIINSRHKTRIINNVSFFFFFYLKKAIKVSSLYLLSQ